MLCVLLGFFCVRSELVEYKYVVMNADGTVDRWQPGDNLKMEVPVAEVSNVLLLQAASCIHRRSC